MSGKSWRRLATGLLGYAVMFASGAALAQKGPTEPRGQLLYGTYCNSCHSTQVHWRDKRLAKDWESLGAQVRRWQGNIGLGWSDDDIREVMIFLNQRYYKFPGAPVGGKART
ncbi:MAG: cytochrome C [Burkholderiales bacterium]|nr:cytochrome C [Burkholderiales bacterium]